jgi:acid phosphatase (class A)
VAEKAASCTPAEEAKLSKDGSYPSGHAALGWAWALVLAEASPAQTNVLLARGHAFGQSRVVCGVHWQSDVDAGRLMGSATVARLHADPVFQAQLKAAAAEINAARATPLPLNRDCAAENAALKQSR